MVRLSPGMVRIPDISFISWDRLPGGKLPDEPSPGLHRTWPSKSPAKATRRQEIERKIQDYSDAGTRLVWVIDGKKQSARIYYSPADNKFVSKNGSLDGEDVPPGFSLAVRSSCANGEKIEGSTPDQPTRFVRHSCIAWAIAPRMRLVPSGGTTAVS